MNIENENESEHRAQAPTGQTPRIRTAVRHPAAITASLPKAEIAEPPVFIPEESDLPEEPAPETDPEAKETAPEAEPPRKSRFFSYAVVAAAALLIGCAVGSLILSLGYRKAISRYQFATTEGAKLKELTDLLDGHYMGEQDKAAQLDAMLHAYVAADGDLYGRYYTADEYAAENDTRAGKGVGIGVTVTEAPDKRGLLVLWVSEGSPAESAGILPGDILVTADGQSYSTLGYEGFLEAIRGEIGSRLTVGFFRGGESLELLEKQLTRSAYVASSVAYTLAAEGKMGLVRILSFDEPTPGQFAAAVASLREQGAEALVFDVRDNPGGLLDSVVEILDTLLPAGTICTTRGTSGEKVYSSDENELDLPMAVLCNENTASAAELFTAALRDYKKAVTVGKTTYGKGVAQSTYALSDGAAVKMTTSYYDPPCGVNYDGVGITPDVEVELSEEAKKTSLLALTEEEDAQLAAAVAALQK